MNKIIEVNPQDLEMKNFETLLMPYICANDIPSAFDKNDPYYYPGCTDVESYINGTILYEPSYSMFGTDCVGGLAYFGKIADILQIKKQANNYLQKNKTTLIYFLWEIENHALLLLYENYQAEIDNPYPKQDNVMFLDFGAWVGDHTLPDLLTFNKDDRQIHGLNWYVGDDAFNDKKKSHQNLLLSFQKVLKIIYPAFSD